MCTISMERYLGSNTDVILGVSRFSSVQLCRLHGCSTTVALCCYPLHPLRNRKREKVSRLDIQLEQIERLQVRSRKGDSDAIWMHSLLTVKII